MESAINYLPPISLAGDYLRDGGWRLSKGVNNLVSSCPLKMKQQNQSSQKSIGKKTVKENQKGVWTFVEKKKEKRKEYCNT